MAAAVATMAAPSQKRKAVFAPDTPSPLPISKKARFEASTKSDEEKAWDSITHEMEHGSPTDDTTPSSPASLPFSLGQSVAPTSVTSTSSKRPKKYVCDYEGCGKAFDRPVRLQTHIRSHTNERPYACEETDCDKTFLRVEHLKRHMQDKHSDDKSYVCTYVLNTTDDGERVECGKSFTTGTRLRRHVATHEAKEETKCNEPGCGKVFRKQETLQRHIKTEHLHEKPYICSHVEIDSEGQTVACRQAFTKADQLRKHEAREHSGMRYFCDICSPPSHHETEGTIEDDLSTTLRVGFPTYADLQHHTKTVHPPTCPQCGTSCASNRALKAHIDIEHVTLPSRQHHKCTWPGCERGFTKAGNLKVHIQSVHMKARNFVCGEFDLTGNKKVEGWNGKGCGSKFGTKANLEEHVRTQHLGIASQIRPVRLRKKIKCETEEEDDVDLDELATPDFTGGNTALAMLTGHGYEQSRKIACLVHGCQVRFLREYDLATHLELTHGWHVDDVNERLAEKTAVEGGAFWIGGGEEMERAKRFEQAIGMEDEEENVGIAEWVMRKLSVGGEYDQEFQRQVEEVQRARVEGYEELQEGMVGVLGTEHFDGVGIVDGMTIDPALRGGEF